MGGGRGIKTAPGTDNGVTVTVLKASLTAATHYPDGYLQELMFFVDDATNAGYVKPVDGTVPAGARVYCLPSNVLVPEAGTAIGLGVWHTGVGLHEGALPFPLSADEKAQAEAQGISLW